MITNPPTEKTVEQAGEQPQFTITIPDTIVIKDFAAKLNKPVTSVVAELMRNGIMLSMNEKIDFDTAAILAEDFGFNVERGGKVEEIYDPTVDLEKLRELLKQDQQGTESRPPVVVVMGHVDHGKTTLLDAIRKTEVAKSEAGGITQAIGAYQVTVKDRKVTFIDTPGHEAFSAMRSRGANVADVAILVVAADDGLKLQTHEALEMIQKVGLPFIVAINKVDKPDANMQKVKTELTEIGLVPEEYGGKTVVAEISAKLQTGIEALLDMVLLVSDLNPEKLRTVTEKPAIGTIIESHIDKGAGAVATVLIQSGTLRIGDLVTAGIVHGKIRSMKDWKGEGQTTADPSAPVQILGLKEAPVVGDVLQVQTDHKTLRERVKEHALRKRPTAVNLLNVAKPEKSAEDEEEEEKPEMHSVKLILKTDTLGSQEAIVAALQKLQHPEVRWQLVKKGLGNINETDVLEAVDHEAVVYGFNVKAIPGAMQAAKEKTVTIETYEVIYHLINSVTQRLEDLLEPEVIQEDLGTLQVLAIFTRGKARMIVGGRVIRGKVTPRASLRIMRKGIEVGTATIEQLQANKKDVPEVLNGHECGMKVKTTIPLEVGDQLEAFIHDVRKRKLTDRTFQQTAST